MYCGSVCIFLTEINGSPFTSDHMGAHVMNKRQRLAESIDNKKKHKEITIRAHKLHNEYPLAIKN